MSDHEVNLKIMLRELVKGKKRWTSRRVTPCLLR